MKSTIRFALSVILFLIACGYLERILAQSSSTGAIIGTVTDESGGVLPNTQVELVNVGTNTTSRAVTNEAGQYTFPNLPPGDYKVKVTAQGFSTTVMDIRVTVGKTALGNISLKLGALEQTVEVNAGAKAELQTIDSAIGEVVTEREITRLPTNQRNALELVALQVGTVPATGISGQYYGRGGAVSGVRGDQNTVTVDGVDTTDGYTSAARGISSLDLPVDAIEEFRSTTANPNALTGATSSGGYFTFATRRGTNKFHGAAYWYHQNDNLNANSWTRNRLGQKNPELKDNRYGGRFGGPIFKEKTFFFGFAERRQFPRSSDGVRIVPSDSFRQGILQFRDGTGAIVGYNLTTSKLCGPANSLACDPRGIGISPMIKDYMNLYPTGNDTSVGDGLNTLGFRSPVDTSSTTNTALFRLDHNFTDNWRFAGSYIYQQLRTLDGSQLELDKNITGGKSLTTLDGSPRDPRHVVLALTGQVTPSLINELRLGWNRQDFGTSATLSRVQLPAAKVPIDLASTLIDDPGDPPANRARPQSVRQRRWSVVDNFTWMMGRHMIQAGFSSERRSFFNARPDRLPLNTMPLAQIRSGSFVTIAASQRPPTCSGSQANCLRSADVSVWNQLYGAMLGIWDNTQILIIRDGQGKPTGELFASNDSVSWHHEIRAMDTWRIRQSLTLNYGLNALIETPWADKNNREFFIAEAGTGKLISPKEVIRLKGEAAAKGQVYNVSVAYVPRETVGREMYPTIRKVGPRAGAAWNPSFSNGILGKLLGNRKTVLRGGYSLLFDRIMATGTITSQISSNEILNSSASILAPTCGFANTPGAGCVSGSSPFRIGVDGVPSAPQPAATVTVPFIPQTRTPSRSFGVTAARAIDPDYGVGRVHGADVTLQRELPGNIILEIGWIGRYGRNLPASFNLNAVPIHLKDMSGNSSQTFAEAFDLVATQLRGGTVASRVTPQPWFENVFGAGQTAAIAAAATSDFTAGRVGSLFLNTIDPRLLTLGKPTVLNQQFDKMSYFSSGGWSNYNAMFMSIGKRMSQGLSLNANWTWSHGLDTSSNSADVNASAWSNPYNPAFDYADALADVRHVIKVYGSYDLPFAKSNKYLGGWYISSIYQIRSGLPISVTQGGDLFGSSAVFGSTTESVPALGSLDQGGGVHSGVTGSNGVGTTGNPATGGTGLSLFSNPEAVFTKLRQFLLAQDGRSQRGKVRGLGFWNIDFSVGKATTIKEGMKAVFAADFFNIFNHTAFNDPSLSILTASSFGVISSQMAGNPARGDFAGPRRIQFGLRLEF